MSNSISHHEAGIPIPNKSTLGARILVVDDDAAIRTLHAAIFIYEGYRVETTADGADALDRLRAGPFDLLITDWNLPGLNGEQLVIAMREAGIRIPVVMISGSLVEYPLSARMAREISAALPKPVRSAEVLAAIRTALHSVQPQLRPAA